MSFGPPSFLVPNGGSKGLLYSTSTITGKSARMTRLTEINKTAREYFAPSLYLLCDRKRSKYKIYSRSSCGHSVLLLAGQDTSHIFRVGFLTMQRGIFLILIANGNHKTSVLVSI